ncbi:MAG: lysophospholipid acyltransferase family protein [Gammaproteobacteria bacterium]|nr:lysophospholipid acyltransferase family protein [Gammaproteobacteria bacterium]
MSKSLLKTVSVLPMSWLYRLSGPFYLLLFYILRFRKKIARDNIRRSFKDMGKTWQSRVLKKHYRNLCDVTLEIARSLAMPPVELERRVSFTNLEVIREPLRNNQPVLLAMAHHCNPVWAILALGQHLDKPVEGIYQPLHVDWLNELTLESLSRFNVTPLPARTCTAQLIRRATDPRAIAIVADQAPRGRDKAYWTNFLHRDTPFYLGLEMIAKMFRYPVYFMALKRTKRGRYEASFLELASPPYEKDSHLISERYARAVETQVLESPQDWLWTHRRWKKKKSLYD